MPIYSDTRQYIVQLCFFSLLFCVVPAYGLFHILPCELNFQLVDDVCVRCQPVMVREYFDTACKFCQPHAVPALTEPSVCTDCYGGWHPVCVDCPNGWQSVCVDCPDDMSSFGTQRICEKCPAGQTRQGSQTKCRDDV